MQFRRQKAPRRSFSERWPLGLSLLRSSWAAVKVVPALWKLPAVSAVAIFVANLIIFAPALGIARGAGDLSESALASSSEHSGQTIFAVAAVLALVLSTIVGVFFNVALASVANDAMEGRETSVSAGLRVARSKLGPIVAWGLIAATVGLLIRALFSAARQLGGIVELIAALAIGGLAIAWNIATFFVVPAIALEGVGPREAMRRSRSVVKARWGEAAIGSVGIGVVAFIAIVAVIVAAAVVVAVGAATGQVFFYALAVLIALAGIVVVAIVASAVSHTFIVAVYRSATGVEPGRFFTQAQLDSVVPDTT